MKEQGALEYLMVYGWALLVIVIVLAAFYSLETFCFLGWCPEPSYRQKAVIGLLSNETEGFFIVKESQHPFLEEQCQRHGGELRIDLDEEIELNLTLCIFDWRVKK